MVLRPVDGRVKFRQVELDECDEEPYAYLKLGRRVDEVVVLVEKAKRPDSRDARQALESLRRACGVGLKVLAVAVVAEECYDARDQALIAQFLRSERSKLKVKAPSCYEEAPRSGSAKWTSRPQTPKPSLPLPRQLLYDG